MENRTYFYSAGARQNDRWDLETNHTHFLLFDDGRSKAQNVLKLRADIEELTRKLLHLPNVDRATQNAIPLVLVVLEGGESACSSVSDALKADIPIVAIGVQQFEI